MILAGTADAETATSVLQDGWLARNLMTVRLAISIYVELRYPRVNVADPTERLIGAIQDFVEARGGRLLFGLQGRSRNWKLIFTAGTSHTRASTASMKTPRIIGHRPATPRWRGAC